MASEDLVDFDLNKLRNFVSHSIFQFLSEDNTTPLTSELLFGTTSHTSALNDEELDALLLTSCNSYENPVKKPRLSPLAKTELASYPGPSTNIRAFCSSKIQGKSGTSSKTHSTKEDPR